MADVSSVLRQTGVVDVYAGEALSHAILDEAEIGLRVTQTHLLKASRGATKRLLCGRRYMLQVFVKVSREIRFFQIA